MTPGEAKADTPGPQKQPTKTPESPKTPVDPGVTISGTTHEITLIWTEENVTRMSATAANASFSGLTQTGMLDSFSAKLYEDGKLSTTVNAPKALADTEKRIVTAMGRVTVKSMTQDTVLKADWIKWYEKEQRVIGDGHVVMITNMSSGKVTTKGEAFVADTALKNIRILSSAKGLK